MDHKTPPPKLSEPKKNSTHETLLKMNSAAFAPAAKKGSNQPARFIKKPLRGVCFCRDLASA